MTCYHVFLEGFTLKLWFLFNEPVSVCIHMKLTYLELSCFLNSKRAVMKSILYSYKHGFSGFAAVLTPSQAKLIAGISQFNHSNTSHIMCKAF